MFVTKQAWLIKRLLLVFLFLNGFIYANSDFATVPASRMENAGYIEFGTFIDQEKTDVAGQLTDVPVASFFTRLGLSNNLEYNLRVRHDMTTLHSFHVAFFRYQTHNNSVEHYFGGGFKNVGWQFPSSSTLTEVQQYQSVNIPIVSGYASYGIASTDGDSAMYLGLGSDANRNGVTVGLGGIEKNFVFGRLLIEYNGKHPIVGLKYSYKNYRLYFSYTIGNEKEQTDDVQTQMFSIGISFAENLVTQFEHLFATKKEIKEFKSDLRFRMEKLERLIEKDQMLRESKFLEDLEESLTKALTGQDEEKEELSIKRAYDHMQKGLEYYYVGNFKKSLKEYNTARKIIPNSVFVNMRLGSVHYQLKNYDEAQEFWRKALSLDPNNEQLQAQMKNLLTPESIKKFEEDRLSQDLKTDVSQLPKDQARRIKIKRLMNLFKDN